MDTSPKKSVNMPPITKVQVLLNGGPLVGATVIAGEVGGQEKITDENGIVSLPDIVPGYAGFTEVYMSIPSGFFATSKAIIKHAQTTIIDLGVVYI